MSIEESLESPVFYILCAVGYGAFALMYIVLKKMEQADIMPWWVKLIVLIAIPLAAMLFTGFAEGG